METLHLELSATEVTYENELLTKVVTFELLLSERIEQPRICGKFKYAKMYVIFEVNYLLGSLSGRPFMARMGPISFLGISELHVLPEL